jgi:hypothetical protein
MPWFRLDEGFHHHPKVRQAGNCAVGLWVRCATYSAQYLTDGEITPEVARLYGTGREVDRLVTAKLWIQHESGFTIPDYLDYNPSAAQVLEERKKARIRQQNRRRGEIKE